MGKDGGEVDRGNGWCLKLEQADGGKENDVDLKNIAREESTRKYDSYDCGE